MRTIIILLFFKYFLCSKNCDDLFILPLENRSFLEKNPFHNLRATHSHASLQMSSLFLVRLRKLLFLPRVSPMHISIFRVPLFSLSQRLCPSFSWTVNLSCFTELPINEKQSLVVNSNPTIKEHKTLQKLLDF